MSYVLTRLELLDKLQTDLGFSRPEAKQLVEAFFDEITSALVAGEDVKLSGFGNFSLRDKSSRPGRNPKTGETFDISARRVVTFKPGRKLRDRVDGLDSTADDD
jgi:integration host factor subunit alpha